MTETSIQQNIADNASGPRKASSDSGSVEQHALPDQIAADKFLESKKAVAKKGLGLKFNKLSPGGTI